MKKRILSAFLCLCMMLTLAPAAFAADADETGGGSTSGDNTQTNTDAIITLGNTEGFKMGVTYTPTADGKTLNIVLSGDVDSTNFTDDSVAIKVTFPKEEGEATAKAYSGTLTLNENKTGVTFKADSGQTLGSYETVNVNVDGINVTSGSTKPEPDPKPEDSTWVDAPDVKKANLVDNGTPKIEKLFDTFEVTADTATKTSTVNEYDQKVTIKATGLKEHENANHDKGYWIGFEVKAPEGTTLIKYQFDGKEAGQTEPEDVVSGKGIAFYFDMAKVPAAKTTTCWAEFCKSKEVATVAAGDTTDTLDSIVKVNYTVDMTGVSYEGETAEDSAAFHFAEPNQDVIINARIEDKVIKLSGSVNESMFANGKVAGKLEYTIGDAVKQTYAILLSLKDGKLAYEKDPEGEATEGLPTGYTLDLSEISVKATEVPEAVEPAAPASSVSDSITNDNSLTSEEKTEVGNIASSVNTSKTEDIVNAAATELTKIVENEQVTETQKVIVFLAVEAKEYNKGENGEVTSVKLDITPKYQVVNKSNGSAINGKPAKDLAVTEPITLTVTLPSSFAGATNVFARHLDASGNEKDRYKVSMSSTTGTFTTENGFSEFEFIKDDRTVRVAYHGISAKEASYFEVDYATSRIDVAHLIKGDGSDYTLDAHEGTFKGWSTKENDTNVEYEAGALLTTTIFDKLYNAATNGVEHLYPVFVKEGSSDKPSGGNTSGGGGGNKRPNSSNNNNNTTTPTTPSDYGNNPSTPSTPSTPVSSTGFSDVAAGGWYESAVQYMKDNGLMAGTSATTFAPDATTTRGMIVTILYRLEKEPEAAASTFSDIAAGEWYSNAVAWAAANNIVSGYENGTFGANDVITREQMAAILFRYASFKGYDVTKTADISSFADAAQVSAYAADAMKWANAAGLISGTSATTLAPTGSATRAQAASILMRFCENVAK